MDEEGGTIRLLYRLLNDTRDYESTDPRDKVYAVLTLLRYTNLKADYRLTIAQTYAKTATYLLDHIGLEILPAAFPSSNRADHTDLPSCIPDWSMPPQH